MIEPALVGRGDDAAAALEHDQGAVAAGEFERSTQAVGLHACGVGAEQAGRLGGVGGEHGGRCRGAQRLAQGVASPATRLSASASSRSGIGRASALASAAQSVLGAQAGPDRERAEAFGQGIGTTQHELRVGESDRRAAGAQAEQHPSGAEPAARRAPAAPTMPGAPPR